MVVAMRSVVAVTALLVIAGCDNESQSVVHQQETRGRHPNATGAIQQCQQALQASATVNPADRPRIVSSACAGLFVEARCRSAWENSATVSPSEQIGHLISECRAAYCPLLNEPKPDLCSSSLTFTTVEQQKKRDAMWAELVRRIQVLDLGVNVPAEVRLRLAGQASLSVEPRLPTSNNL